MELFTRAYAHSHVAAINYAGINAAKTTLTYAASPRSTLIALADFWLSRSQRDPPTN